MLRWLFPSKSAPEIQRFDSMRQEFHVLEVHEALRYEYMRGLDPKTTVFLLRFVREEYPEMSTHDAISSIIMY